MRTAAINIICALLLGMIGAGAYAQVTIWACSNHRPYHTATSTQQIQNLTYQFGCAGWRIISQ